MTPVPDHSVDVTVPAPVPVEPSVEEVVAVAADEPRALELAPPQRTAAVAATGFAAGVATMAVMHRRALKKARRRKLGRRAGDLLPIVGSRSFLVDVHLIGSRD
jgi:hypothetical protein